jgi:hypothetical protein
MVAGLDRLQHQLTGLSLALCLAALGCQGGEARSARATHVDSLVSREEELALFREGLLDPPGGAFRGGAASRDELVRRFVGALEHRDTAALRELLLTRAEFAYLYYPTNPEARPPYDLSPGLMWFLLDGNSRKGFARALDERGGRPLRYVGYACEGGPGRQAANTVWASCVVRRLQAPGDTVAERLFGPIVERGGRFKFVSYANKL